MVAKQQKPNPVRSQAFEERGLKSVGVGLALQALWVPQGGMSFLTIGGVCDFMLLSLPNPSKIDNTRGLTILRAAQVGWVVFHGDL
jgi:hypothetical protein